jgi:serine/threonine-protein kinase
MSDLFRSIQTALADRYQLERELGRGGMATVFLARDLKHPRHVAIKVLRPELAGVMTRGRFLREIRISAELAHPHILPLLDSGTIPPSDDFPALPFYTMPFVEGESLRDRLTREQQLPIDEAIPDCRRGGGRAGVCAHP